MPRRHGAHRRGNPVRYGSVHDGLGRGNPYEAGGRVRSRGPRRARLRSRYHSRLGGAWQPDDPQTVLGKWADSVTVRGRVVHAGYRPSEQEVIIAANLLREIEHFVMAVLKRLKFKANRRVIARPAGRERRGLYAGRSRSLSDPRRGTKTAMDRRISEMAEGGAGGQNGGSAGKRRQDIGQSATAQHAVARLARHRGACLGVWGGMGGGATSPGGGVRRLATIARRARARPRAASPTRAGGARTVRRCFG